MPITHYYVRPVNGNATAAKNAGRLRRYGTARCVWQNAAQIR